ncbi:MAG: acylneuraminate cytidylyltransferase [Chloroflexota bacterium]
MIEEILAIIPARGGSKGIPKKNLQPLNGKPLLAYSIESALATPFITRVVVSTDDPEIGAAAQQLGAEVVWRPAEISGDLSSSEDALLHALEHLETNESYCPDILVFLQCTSPLTTPEDIEGSIQTLIDQEADTTLAVTPFHYFLWKPEPNGSAVGINHDKSFRPLRQQREPQFLETGAVYVMRVEGFKKTRHRFFGKTAMYIMPPERCFEIDEPVDLLIAEVLMRELGKTEAIESLPNPVGALILDFDGVFTDNKVIVFEDGREAVIADRGDGWGLAQLKQRGIPILVLSTETNPVVEARCNKLSLQYLQGVQDKKQALLEWLRERSIDPSRTVYVGNDLNDLECLQAVGCGVVVADAHPDVRRAARLVLKNPGGQGAIREIADLILRGTGALIPPFLDDSQ